MKNAGLTKPTAHPRLRLWARPLRGPSGWVGDWCLWHAPDGPRREGPRHSDTCKQAPRIWVSSRQVTSPRSSAFLPPCRLIVCGKVQTPVTAQEWLESTPEGRRPRIRRWRAGGSIAVASSTPATPPTGMTPTPITRSIGRNCRQARRSALSASRSRKSRTPTKASRSMRPERCLEWPVVRKDGSLD